MISTTQGRRTSIAGPSSVDPLESELDSFDGQPIIALRRIWRARLTSGPPAIQSRGIMARLLAWKIQEKVYGGLDRTAERKLREIADALERDISYQPKHSRRLSPGVTVTREWKGVIHKVSVGANGFEYQGKRYKSLSVIARAITGTRWSGPRFFGLDQSSAPKHRKARP